MKYGFGVDLGGTTVKIAYFDENGTMLDTWEIPTVTAEGGKQILPDIAASINDYRRSHSIPDTSLLGLGIGVPGPVDASGMVNRCVNLGWGCIQHLQRAGGPHRSARQGRQRCQRSRHGRILEGRRQGLQKYGLRHPGHRRWRRHHH